MRTFHRSTKNRATAVQAIHRRRLGLTLVELMMVSAVMALLAGTMAALATTVQVANQQQLGRGLAVQHGQVAIQRIERAIQGATTSEQFPGFIVVRQSIASSTFPDTLAVWSPTSTPIAPDGLPRVNELVVFTPMYEAPTRLVELRNSSDTREVPALADAGGWRSLVSMMKMSAVSGSNSTAPVLTDLVRTAEVTDPAGNTYGRRSCIRFEQMLRPSAAEWQAYQAGSASWQSLPWAQGIVGGSVGLRQALCRIELQLRPGDIDSHDKQIAIPFFGSAALYYELER